MIRKSKLPFFSPRIAPFSFFLPAYQVACTFLINVVRGTSRVCGEKPLYLLLSPIYSIRHCKCKQQEVSRYGKVGDTLKKSMCPYFRSNSDWTRGKLRSWERGEKRMSHSRAKRLCCSNVSVFDSTLEIKKKSVSTTVFPTETIFSI